MPANTSFEFKLRVPAEVAGPCASQAESPLPRLQVWLESEIKADAYRSMTERRLDVDNGQAKACLMF